MRWEKQERLPIGNEVRISGEDGGPGQHRRAGCAPALPKVWDHLALRPEKQCLIFFLTPRHPRRGLETFPP